jgi:hypothetical protein
MITTDNYIRFTRVDAVDDTDTDALAGRTRRESPPRTPN